uniref:Uncharacterized protein n=1 Tax=Nelumbo nucifera TaxID=4432 RepID=A0A822XWR2_NELNU|nr:TPA_asm: hypothetical protein HUJ06_026224 [Nelumbo nucifera]
MNVGGDFGGSNLALLQGFSLPSKKNAIQRTIHQLIIGPKCRRCSPKETMNSDTSETTGAKECCR